MKTNPILKWSSLALVLAIGAAVQAADVNDTDQKFIKNTASAGMSELKIAELAVGKAQNAEVKELASMLVTDHTKMNSELAGLAKTKNVQLSAVIDPSGADTFKDLEKHSGKDFDVAFLDHMSKCHNDDIDAFEDAEKNATDGDLKAWVSKTLPTLKMHRDRVKQIRDKLDS